MAQRVYRGNLSAVEFPLNPLDFGASVIVAGPDQTLSRYVDTTESRDASIGIPQIFFASNVLPTKEGLSSTRFLSYAMTDVPAVSHVVAGIGTIVGYLYNEAGDKLPCFLVTADYNEETTNYSLYLVHITRGGERVWHLLWDAVSVDAYTLPLTTTYVQGHNFIFVPTMGLYWFNPVRTAPYTVSVTMPALEINTLLGIITANGYLMAYSDKAVAWSTVLDLLPGEVQRSTDYAVDETVRITSTQALGAVQWKCTTAGTTAATAPTYSTTIGSTTTDGTCVFTCEALSVDFEPSLVTGAGGGNVEALKGNIVVCRPTISGFIAYATNNAVLASYTQNAESPYTFREIQNSAGVSVCTDVTDSANIGWHYALTKSGIQQVASTGAKSFEPALQDWMVAEARTDISIVAGVPTLATSPAAQNEFGIFFVGKRYLCVSRGDADSGGIFTETIVYDTALSRYGRIVYPHTSIVDYCGVICLLNAGGSSEVTLVQFHPTSSTLFEQSSVNVYTVEELGLVALGRYRYVREQQIRLQEVYISNLYTLNNATSRVYALRGTDRNVALVGVPGPMVEAVANRASGKVRCLCGNAVYGDDVSLVVTAPFRLNTIELVFTSGGHR